MNKKFIGLCATIMICTGVVAQDDEAYVQQLDEVVVSDSRFELKRENSGKTVIKITAEDIKRNQGKTIAEIINAQSGFSIAGSNSREGTVLGVYARGGRGRQVLVLVDGVRISDPSLVNQEYDLRLLSTANVASIEIIKGAASTLYGTNAATAVINITTKKSSENKISGNFQSSIGTNHTTDDQNYNIADFSNSVSVNGTLDKFTYNVGFSNRYSDGLSALVTPTNENDDYSSYSTDIKLGYAFSERLKVGIYGNQTNMRAQFDESFGMYDAPYEYLSDQKRVGLSTEYKYNNGSLVLNTAISEYISESKDSYPAIYEGKNRVVDLYNKYSLNDKLYTILGLNYIHDETEYAEVQDYTIVDPYVNVVYVSDFGLNLNTGMRANNHSEYGSHFVYNVNPSFVIKKSNGYVKLMGSYATSYITPSLNQLFGNFGANPDLEPEENQTIEGGLEYMTKNDIRFSALYFNRKEKNFVFYGANGYDNSENTIDASGVEVELEWMPVSSFTIGANYTFTEREGDNAIRLPKHRVNAFLGYDFSKRTNASVNFSMTGKRKDTDFGAFPSVDVDLDSYSVLDFYIAHQVLENKLTFFLNASNLLNEQYTEIFGLTTKGRNIRLGLNLSL
ncbi:Vitamin B12 transporter BtuB [Arenibacter antarcticus]|uniref:TonB-dependent receptor plug domain-containing protein n=1 Tax=Arenibacter antarcticus TaxID=2040469 RepID=A0ABW5VLQ0_9FLAO|nr:TonB-dependent receptor plug domain-containing protein [Arenibacter sp. H213]MCM4169168.1 TonB-dependent receptor [Arenibacter sp. H213]